MAYSTITKPSLHFNTKLYTGSSSAQSITGVGFQPDWTWIKNRSTANWHNAFDAVRGAGKVLYPNANTMEGTDNSLLSAFDSDGFSVGTNTDVNNNGVGAVSWNWKANGAGSSNSDGSIATTVSANTTTGFSIVTYTGTGNAGATIGHGLGAVPKWILIKKRAGGSARDWAVYHGANTSAPETEILYLNNTDATADSIGYWNDTAPTSSVITLGAANEVNEYNTHTYVAYCFAEKKGYSKFGKYIGNGNSNGTFVYTGFKPALIIIKRTDTTSNWTMFDNKRDGFNCDQAQLKPNLSDAEDAGSASTFLDILSNGFRCRNNASDKNGNGGTYIYMAFAEEPLVANVGSGIPATAR